MTSQAVIQLCQISGESTCPLLSEKESNLFIQIIYPLFQPNLISISWLPQMPSGKDKPYNKQDPGEMLFQLCSYSQILMIKSQYKK